MNGENHEGGERDWRDDPGNGSRTLDKLSREEILRALAGLNERLKADAEDTYSLLARGMLHSRQGDDRRAVEDSSLVIELEPDNAEALQNRAAARDDLGEHHLAREDYDAVIRLEPDNAVAAYSRGACLAKLGDLAGAVKDFDHAIILEPGDAIPYYNRGCTYAEMGDPRRALEDFNQAISLDPGNPIFFHYRGMAHRELGEFDQAVSDFDTAIGLEPLSNPSRHARGVARVMQGEYERAILDFDAVLELDPDNADTLGGRGVARSALGEPPPRRGRGAAAIAILLGRVPGRGTGAAPGTERQAQASNYFPLRVGVGQRGGTGKGAGGRRVLGPIRGGHRYICDGLPYVAVHKTMRAFLRLTFGSPVGHWQIAQRFAASEHGRVHHRSLGSHALALPFPKLLPNNRRHILMESSIDGDFRASWAI